MGLVEPAIGNEDYCAKVPKGQSLLHELSLLLKSDEDLFRFRDIERKSKSLELALTEYRMQKLDEQNISLEQFKAWYSESPVHALENLFLAPVDEYDVNLLVDLIEQGEWTLASLYQTHQRRPYKSLQMIIS
ncbi:hypothetical protein QB910_000091 [Dabrowskivirus KKP3916]|uniref:Uncharacterized protein n=1 Tax=Alicyclobacillus phage KKP_3916 TaxID=3040651 RepID=A0AAT9V7M8_9CAUD|nr:hypothetical protein QB910_000091 [Alicyclobacillus phage KKP 3916]